jgi:hypothetical protein
MIHYKIKKSDSPEYWTGYSSTFSRNGVAYRTLEDVGTAIKAQMTNSRHGIRSWIGQAQVIAFEVVTNVICSYDLTATVELAKLYDTMQNTHGKTFLRGFKQLLKRDPDNIFKYAIEVATPDIDDFRTSMRDLGFSSRYYRKVGNWFFFNDDDLCVRVKLAARHTKFVNMHDYCESYKEHTVSTPADNSLLDDATFEDDCELDE